MSGDGKTEEVLGDEDLKRPDGMKEGAAEFPYQYAGTTAAIQSAKEIYKIAFEDDSALDNKAVLANHAYGLAGFGLSLTFGNPGMGAGVASSPDLHLPSVFPDKVPTKPQAKKCCEQLMAVSANSDPKGIDPATIFMIINFVWKLIRKNK